MNKMLMDNIFVCEVYDGVIMYNFNNLNVIHLKKNEFEEIVQHIKKNGMSPIEYKWFFSRNRIKMSNVVDEGVTPIIFTGYKCNYSCDYCYQHKHKKNTLLFDKGLLSNIEEFYRVYGKLFGINTKIKEISIIGGEPLLDENITLFTAISKKWGSKKIYISTNGVNIKKYSSLLKKMNCELHVSIDGTEEIHYKRRHPMENTYYQKTIDGITWLAQNKIPFHIMSLFFADNARQFPKFLNQLEMMGIDINENTVNLMLKYDNCGEDINNDYLRECLLAVKELSKVEPRLQNINLSKLAPGIDAFFKKDVLFHKCGRLINSDFVFFPNGKVSICQASDNEELLIGRFSPDIFIDIDKIMRFHQRNIINMKKCRECKYSLVCRGGCVASATYQKKSILEENCFYWKDENWMESFEIVGNIMVEMGLL